MNKKSFDIAIARLGIPAIGLAYRLGVSPSLISKWRNWGNVPNKYRRVLCRTLKVRRKELFGLSKEE